jgi:ADP-ribose pyrophosphatase YjhB (NUDIX family)
MKTASNPNQKIMAIIYSEKGNFLLLRTNPKWMKCDVWFIVTGSIRKNESKEKAVRREVSEETGLEIIEIKPTYECPKNSGIWHKETAFLVKVKEARPILSGEHLEFKWLTKEDFIKQIDWDESIDSKDKLKEILKMIGE